MRLHRSLPIVAVAGLAVAGCGSSGKSTSSSASAPPSTPRTTQTTPAAPTTPVAATKPAATIAAVLADYTVVPTPPIGKAGQVTFKVTNQGQVPHEFVVIRTPKPAGSLLNGSKADEAGKVGEAAGELAPGTSKTVKLKLVPGHYVLLCNLPGHYTSGQHVDFSVR
jgi:uncharacterized cupredoxin-like copper-binding protein